MLSLIIQGKLYKRVEINRIPSVFTGAKAKEKQNRQSSFDRLKTFQLTEACFINMLKK